jgi:Ca-activated chloride channel family protein
MQFAHPKMLWLLAVTVPILSLFLWRSWRKKQFLIGQFVRSRLLAHLTVGLSRKVQKARMVLIIVAVALIMLAMARPQWGFAWQEATHRGLDVIVAIDASRSMLAEDIAPNRLERAKLAALDLMRLARRDRIGLVAFAGTAFLQCPLTLDDEAFRQSVVQLDVNIMPQGGTALAEAIRTAHTALKGDDANHRVVVLFSDGEDHDTGAVQAAEEAQGAGVKIFTVGVGTPAGELLRQRDQDGNSAYIKDPEGNVVKSRLNQGLLTEIATAGGGFYLPMSGANTVEVLYQRGLAPLPGAESSSMLVKEYQERFQWPLALALALLIIEVFVPERKRVPRSEVIEAASNPELRKLVAAGLLALVAIQAFASPSSALRKYESGQFNDAYREYSRLSERRPDDVRLQFNAGASAYQARKYGDAVNHFSAAVAASDPQLQERAYYNLGNALFRVGEEKPDQEKVQLWEQSIREFETALKLDPKDADAQANLEYVRRRLEELKKQQQQQSQDKQQQKDKNQDKNQDQEQQEDKRKEDGKDQQSQDSNQQSEDQQKNQGQEQEPESSESQKPSDEESNEKNERSQPNQEQQGQPPSDQSKDSKPGSAESSASAPMTPEQVKQLLDSQKGNEKALIFTPPEQKQKRNSRVFKDW